jgi:hypothetical protein
MTEGSDAMLQTYAVLLSNLTLAEAVRVAGEVHEQLRNDSAAARRAPALTVTKSQSKSRARLYSPLAQCGRPRPLKPGSLFHDHAQGPCFNIQI